MENKNEPENSSSNKDNPADYLRQLEHQCEAQRKALKKLIRENSELKEKIAQLEEKNSTYENKQLDKSQSAVVRRYARESLFNDLKVVN
jgi:phage shock protein A